MAIRLRLATFETCRTGQREASIGHGHAKTYIKIRAFRNRRSLDAERNTNDDQDKKAVHGGHDERALVRDVTRRRVWSVLTIE